MCNGCSMRVPIRNGVLHGEVCRVRRGKGGKVEEREERGGCNSRRRINGMDDDEELKMAIKISLAQSEKAQK